MKKSRGHVKEVEARLQSLAIQRGNHVELPITSSRLSGQIEKLESRIEELESRIEDLIRQIKSLRRLGTEGIIPDTCIELGEPRSEWN